VLRQIAALAEASKTARGGSSAGNYLAEKRRRRGWSQPRDASSLYRRLGVRGVRRVAKILRISVAHRKGAANHHRDGKGRKTTSHRITSVIHG
jgi:hypothetical protein